MNVVKKKRTKEHEYEKMSLEATKEKKTEF